MYASAVSVHPQAIACDDEFSRIPTLEALSPIQRPLPIPSLWGSASQLCGSWLKVLDLRSGYISPHGELSSCCLKSAGRMRDIRSYSLKLPGPCRVGLDAKLAVLQCEALQASFRAWAFFLGELQALRRLSSRYLYGSCSGSPHISTLRLCLLGGAPFTGLGA